MRINLGWARRDAWGDLAKSNERRVRGDLARSDV
jgi:hypothetical protein